MMAPSVPLPARNEVCFASCAKSTMHVRRRIVVHHNRWIASIIPAEFAGDELFLLESRSAQLSLAVFTILFIFSPKIV